MVDDASPLEHDLDDPHAQSVPAPPPARRGQAAYPRGAVDERFVEIEDEGLPPLEHREGCTRGTEY
jgi:hypothetical protein